MHEKDQSANLSRRGFLRLAGLLAGAGAAGSLLAACQQAASAPTPTAAPKAAPPTQPAAAPPTAAPAAPTQAAPALKLSQKLQLKFATISAESFPYVDGAKKWAELLAQRSGGMVELQIFHSAQLGDERTINEGILAGSIHAGVGAGNWAGYVPAYNVVELPFLIKDLKHMYQLADGELGERIAKLGEEKGYKVLAYFSTGDQHFQTKAKRVETIDDFKGLKMRVMENNAIIEGFRALGAVPTPIPYPNIYTAIQQGTVDGSAVDTLSVTTLKLYEVIKFQTMSTYLAEPRPLIMQKRFFDSQPPEVQKLLVDTAREAAAYERKVFEDKLSAGIEEMKKNGVTIVELKDKDKWVAAVEPVWEAFGKETAGAADLIALVKKTR